MCERNIDSLPLVDCIHNLGMCPDPESKWQPFALWDDAQPTEPHLSGLCLNFLININVLIFMISGSFQRSNQ